MRIDKHLTYYECIFSDGTNLITFTFKDMLQQLKDIYNITFDLFTFNLN